MSSPYYLFLFERFQMEIPYKQEMIHLYPPWTYAISIGSCLVYLFLITAVFPWFTSKLTPSFKESFGKLHHALLFLYSLFSFLAAFYHIVVTGEITSWTRYICDPLPPWLRAVSITFTLSKIWEWIDTAILIWKGHSLKKIGFLHTYHHATTFLLMLCVMNLPGPEKGGMLLNGFVHVLMYYHFAFRLSKIFRPIITGLQIIQLITLTYMWHIVPDLCPNYRNFSRDHLIIFLVPYALVPVYCLFFLKFFIEQYVFSPGKSSTRKND
ncbi:unnamed protein product [Adineta ricciae]|uniref:Elongation of very long chain fatty acids protein n=1 Tax=Adineta ricciae TaxID=249248 RepID=A0A814UES6_ADIRI|nr:unnamed protein product [Adineta ricciae]CAF1173472.1 unnamed protein product [Adineta ricciae]